MSGDVDLTGEALPPTRRLATAEYDPAEDREHARRKIAYWLIGLLFAVMLGVGFLFVQRDDVTLDGLAVLTATFITPTIGLVSFVLGFYFGNET